MREPLDPFSKVLDERSHWDPEWYSWIKEVSSNINSLTAAVAANTAAIGAFGATWQNWVPALGANTGTIAGTTSGRFVRLGKTVIATFAVSVTSSSGPNYVIISLPVAVGAFASTVGFHRESSVTGLTGVSILVSATTALLVNYDNSGTAIVGRGYQGVLIYEGV